MKTRGVLILMPDKTPKNQGREYTSFEELARANTLINEALIRLLVEKHIISSEEIDGRVKLLNAETRFELPPPTARNEIVVTREDLISSNSFVVELLLDLLVEKDFLTTEEMLELKARMEQRAKTLLRTQ
jgi:hypothetical protein